VDVSLLFRKDPDSARALINSAPKFYKYEEDVRVLVQVNLQTSKRYRLRLYNMPNTIPLSSLTHQSYEGQVIQFKGIVTQVAPVRKLTSKKVYACKGCNTLREFNVSRVDTMLDLPRSKLQMWYCKECKHRMPWVLSSGLCVFVPVQRIVLQETLEEVLSGKPPTKINCYLMDDLAQDKVKIGDQITAVGIIHPDIRESNTTFSVYAELLSFAKMKSSYEEIKITLDDIEEFKKIRDNPDLYGLLVKSFAPTIFGHETEKLAILCTLFGAPRITSDSTTLRGDIHLLLTGDPSTSKSMMLDWAAKVSPKGIVATGQRASQAGLTASWIKGRDNIPEVEPGAFVIADGGGLVCIDEMEKMKEADRMSIHRPMEQQEVNLVMAGVVQKFNARCAVIGAANPKGGRYDPEKSLVENINLDLALLSRFDLIFIIRDLPTMETEEKLATHILKTHGGSSRVAPIPLEMLRKYIAYARREIEPGYDPNGEAAMILKEGYLKVRLQQSGDAVPASPRQLEGFIRLSKALARMQLSNIVARSHAEKAIQLYMASAKPVMLEPEEATSAIRRTPVEKEIWAQILAEPTRVILIRRLMHNNPGRESIVERVIQDAIASGELVAEGPDNIKVVKS
jgi:replicative DNA helicase Mcm